MSVIQLDESDFEATVTAPGIVVVDWWAAWCGPCRAFAPVFEKAAARHEGMTFAKIDTEANPGLSGAMQIRSIPTLMVFRDGILVFNQAGMLPASALDEVLRKVAELDMDEVRADIDEAQSARRQEDHAAS